MKDNWRPVAAGALVACLVVVVIWFSWTVLRPSSDDGTTSQDVALEEEFSESESQDELPDVGDFDDFGEPGDGVDHDHYHDHGDLDFVEVEASADELSERLVAFEEGFRSFYRTDTAAERRTRVANVVRADRLEYLNFDVADVFLDTDQEYDTVAVVGDVDAIVDGLMSQLATGEVTLVIEVTYIREYDDGETQTIGSLSKRSRWELTDNGWLLVGADPA